MGDEISLGSFYGEEKQIFCVKIQLKLSVMSEVSPPEEFWFLGHDKTIELFQ